MVYTRYVKKGLALNSVDLNACNHVYLSDELCLRTNLMSQTF